MSEWYPFTLSGPIEIDGALTILGADADRLILGGTSAEGGDIKVYADGSGNLALTLDADTGQLTLPISGTGAGILFGADIHLYRGSANTLWFGTAVSHDNIMMPGIGRIYRRDTAIFTSSRDDGHYDIDADTSVDINSPILEISTTNKVQFRDSAIYINSSGDTFLDVVADGAVQVASPQVYLYSAAADADILIRSNTDDAVLTLDSGDDGTPEESHLKFQDDRADKWDIYKDTSDALHIYDTAQTESLLIFASATPSTITVFEDTHFEFRDAAIYVASLDDGHMDLEADITVDVNSGLVGIIDAITADTAGTAASLVTVTTEVTTDGDQNLDDVTLANGQVGQLKAFVCVAEGHGGDTWKVTPDTMNGGTQITFTGAVGEGCVMIYNTTVGWTVVGNNGGTIA